MSGHRAIRASARAVIGRAGCGSATALALTLIAPSGLSAAARARVSSGSVTLVPATSATVARSPSKSATIALATSATIVPSLTPDRLGARASLTLAMAFAGGEAGVPAPVRRASLRLPAGMTLYVPHLSACTAAGLRARGTRGCPTRSLLGDGSATAEARVGAGVITETVALHLFLGPPHNLRPTFTVLAEGETPVESRVVFSGSTLGDTFPYGERLEMSMPLLATLPQASDASVLALSMTVGVGGRRRQHNAVLVPVRCPAGGFPVAAEFLYADGSSGGAHARIPCPR